jgi:hypothetical protein
MTIDIGDNLAGLMIVITMLLLLYNIIKDFIEKL